MCEHVLHFALLQKYVIDRVLEDDGVTGDQYGPFNPEHIKEERERLKQSKVSTCHLLPARNMSQPPCYAIFRLIKLCMTF